MLKTLVPKDRAEWLRLREPNINSTESASLFGISPYSTAYEIWHRKHDNLQVEIEPSERMRWGSRLEKSIAEGVAEDQGWSVRKMDEYIWDDELRMGSSFDYAIGDDGILEVKNVDSLAFRDGWIVDGDNVEASPSIEMQVQHQLALTGRKFAWISALIGGNRVVLIKREQDTQVIEAIRKRIREFWISVESHNEPRPDFSRDSDFIAHLYSYSEPGKVFNADEAISKLAFAYKQATAEAKAASDKKDAAKAEILTLVGNAEKVVGETFTISAGLTGPALIPAYERKGYRNFKISWKKEK